MVSHRFEQSLVTVFGGLLLGWLVGASITPPDPFTQVLYTAVLLPLLFVTAYVLHYRRGFVWTEAD